MRRAVHAQGAKRLTVTEDWRIDAEKERLTQTTLISIGPAGTIVLAPMYGMNAAEISAWDSAGTKNLWRLPIGTGDKYEIRFVNRIGWTGPQLWVSDRSYEQVALIDATGKVTKSIEVPNFMRPTLAERRKWPLFDGNETLARYVDGSFLIRAGPPTKLIDTPGYDTTKVPIMLTNASGVITRMVASIPADVMIAGPRPNQFRPAPLPNRTLYAVSPDGMRLATAAASFAGKDSATFALTMINERGDTVLARRYPFTPQPVDPRSRDSLAKQLGGSTPAASALPKFFPALTRLVVGRDRSILVAFRAPPKDTASYPFVLIGADGAVIGTGQIPRRYTIGAIDRNHVWALERRVNVTKAIIRLGVR
jgi:hypothetical protein